MGARFRHRFIEAAPDVPAEGLCGAALVEAYAGSYQDLMRRIEGAISLARTQLGATKGGAYIRALYPDVAIVELYPEAGPTSLWSYPYEADSDTSVKLGAPTQVVETFRPVAAKVVEAAGSVGALVEAAGDDKAPLRFACTVIEGGLSLNGNYYPDKALKGLVKLVEGAPVFHKPDQLHLARGGKDVERLIGRITGPRFVEGASGKPGRVDGVLEMIDRNHAISVKLCEAVKGGMQGLFGLSIDADGEASTGKAGTRKIQIAEAFTKVRSVDLIVEPGAGGRVISFTEAAQESDVDVSLILASIAKTRPDLVQGRDATNTTPAQAVVLLEAAMTPQPPDKKPPEDTDAAVHKAAQLIEARQDARERINTSKLPALAKQKLIAQFKEAQAIDMAAVDAAIKAEADYLASFTESGKVQGLGDQVTIEIIKDRVDKFGERLDAFFDPEHKHHRAARSFREAYIDMTGDKDVSGERPREARFTESMDTSSMAYVLGDSINRRALAMYRSAPTANWRAISNVVPVSDFKTQHRTRWGGYGDLPIVNQSGSYNELDSPDDEEATYGIQKRGGTEDLTREMIKNDDVGLIRQIPVKLGRAAARTLAKFVFDFIRLNGTIYDGNALFHASHGNLGTTALDAANYAPARLAFVTQTEYGVEDQIGIDPKYLLVPFGLQQTASDLFKRGTNNDPTFVQSLNPIIVPVWYWTDANDWALAADPLDIPGLEIGFMDGKEEPEIFIQDDPRSGSMFSNDKMVLKIRHEYGGAITDWRQFRKHVVA